LRGPVSEAMGEAFHALRHLAGQPQRHHACFTHAVLWRTRRFLSSHFCSDCNYYN
jgi:hypothetical protein